jgi:hypothetical protein
MNTINVPGFTAEATLYKSEGSYTAALIFGGGSEISGIHPAASIRLRSGNGVGAGAACFAVCWAACEFVGAGNCVDFCADICGVGVIIIVVEGAGQFAP